MSRRFSENYQRKHSNIEDAGQKKSIEENQNQENVENVENVEKPQEEEEFKLVEEIADLDLSKKQPPTYKKMTSQEIQQPTKRRSILIDTKAKESTKAFEVHSPKSVQFKKSNI